MVILVNNPFFKEWSRCSGIGARVVRCLQAVPELNVKSKQGEKIDNGYTNMSKIRKILFPMQFENYLDLNLGPFKVDKF